MNRLKVTGVLLLVLMSFIVVPAADGGLFDIVSPELTDAANLESLWAQKIPLLGRREVIDKVYLIGTRIYALTSSNYLFSLDSSNGKVIFGRPVAEKDIPIMGLEVFGDSLYYFSGSKLTELDIDHGSLKSQRKLSVRIVAPPARNSSFFYFPGINDRVSVMRASDQVKIFDVAADNDSSVVTLKASEEYFTFGTEAGNIVVVAAGEPVKLWQFDTDGAVALPLVLDEGGIYAASADTNIYALDFQGKKLLWKYQCSAILDEGPVVTRKAVYQYVKDFGLLALSRSDGKILWKVPGGESLLSSADGISYLLHSDGRLVVMDDISGKKIYSVNFEPVDIGVVNTDDSRIFIAAEDGRINCLQPKE